MNQKQALMKFSDPVILVSTKAINNYFMMFAL